MAQIPATKCGICQNIPGHLFCRQCKCYMCRNCKTWHEKFPATRTHNVYDSHQVQTISRDKFTCIKHQSDFVFFCETCDSLTCQSCVTSDHKRHSFKGIQEIVLESRNAIKENIRFLESNIQTLSDLIEQTKSEKYNQIKIGHRYKDEVEKMSADFTTVIESVADNSISRVSNNCKVETQHLDFEVAKLEKALQEHTSFCAKVKQVLAYKNDVEFFMHQKPLSVEFNDIKDIPSVQKPESLGELSKENFTAEIMERIQAKFNIRISGSKQSEDEKKALQNRLNQNERDLKKEATENDCRKRLIEALGERLRKKFPPVKQMDICRQFNELYDNEWTDAYAAFTDFKTMNNTEIITVLLRITKEIYQACKDDLSQQLLEYGPIAESECLELAMETLTMKFASALYKKITSEGSICESVYKYKDYCRPLIENCVKIFYFTLVQDPPMYLEFEPGYSFDRTVFRDYGASGSKTQYLVWPALFLCKGGQLLSKGVVQAV